MVRATTYESSGAATTVVTPSLATRVRMISWGAVFAGVVISLITQFLLSMLGVGIGVSTIDPATAGTPEAGTFSIAGAIWWTVSGIISAFVGGWVAARLSGVPIATSASLHGLVTWATTMLVVFYLLTSAAGALIGGAFGVMSNVMSGLGQTAQAVVPQLADATQGPLAELRQEIEGVIRGTDQAQQAESLTTTTRVVTADDLSPAERDQAAGALAQQAGISQDEARNRIDQWRETYRRNAEQLQQQARQTAEMTARVVSRAAIYGFIALVLGAIAGTLGGRAGRPEEQELATPAD
ncbi:MAG TPA: PhnA-like protein [Alphaproteobacteria bacterium]